MRQKIFYLAATARIPPRHRIPSTEGGAEVLANAVIHFYLRSEDQATAGAVAHDICREIGVDFVDYVYLPGEESAETLHRSPEHKAAFQLALEKGESWVLSQVFDESHVALDPSSFER